jgi:hypothetical protein
MGVWVHVCCVLCYMVTTLLGPMITICLLFMAILCVIRNMSNNFGHFDVKFFVIVVFIFSVVCLKVWLLKRTFSLINIISSLVRLLTTQSTAQTQNTCYQEVLYFTRGTVQNSTTREWHISLMWMTCSTRTYLISLICFCRAQTKSEPPLNTTLPLAILDLNYRLS